MKSGCHPLFHKNEDFDMSDCKTENTKTMSQDDIDRQEMIAGAELGRVLLELAAKNPEAADSKKSMAGIKSLVIPSRYKDLSAEELRKMLMNKYIESASIAMVLNLEATEYKVTIPINHNAIIGDLTAHWKAKGYNVKIQGNDNEWVVTLLW